MYKFPSEITMGLLLVLRKKKFNILIVTQRSQTPETPSLSDVSGDEECDTEEGSTGTDGEDKDGAIKAV